LLPRECELICQSAIPPDAPERQVVVIFLLARMPDAMAFDSLIFKKELCSVFQWLNTFSIRIILPNKMIDFDFDFNLPEAGTNGDVRSCLLLRCPRRRVPVDPSLILSRIFAKVTADAEEL
jgi:hypothetical protein